MAEPVTFRRQKLPPGEICVLEGEGGAWLRLNMV